jgi:hypothetical protein
MVGGEDDELAVNGQSLPSVAPLRESPQFGSAIEAYVCYLANELRPTVRN